MYARSVFLLVCLAFSSIAAPVPNLDVARKTASIEKRDGPAINASPHDIVRSGTVIETVPIVARGTADEEAQTDDINKRERSQGGHSSRKRTPERKQGEHSGGKRELERSQGGRSGGKREAERDRGGHSGGKREANPERTQGGNSSG